MASSDTPDPAAERADAIARWVAASADAPEIEHVYYPGLTTEVKWHQYDPYDKSFAGLRGELHNAAIAVEQVNRDNGWYDDDRRFAEDIALLHSEVSEALEAFRSWGTADATKVVSEGLTIEIEGVQRPVLPKPEGVGSEMADILVRLLDTCKRYDIDLGAEFARKLTFNRTRGYKHGGKKL